MIRPGLWAWQWALEAWRKGVPNANTRPTIAGVIRTKDDVHRAEAELAAWERDTGDQTRWWMGGFALVLKDVRLLPFTPLKGALGLFEVPDDVVKPLIARAA